MRIVFGDNVLEVFVDPDGSTHYYKEFEINAINITFDLELNKVSDIHNFFYNFTYIARGIYSVCSLT